METENSLRNFKFEGFEVGTVNDDFLKEQITVRDNLNKMLYKVKKNGAVTSFDGEKVYEYNTLPEVLQMIVREYLKPKFTYKKIRSFQDCSAEYEVVFEEACTVEMFINEIVMEGKTWGNFYIQNTYCNIEYKRNQLIDQIPEEYAKSNIQKATCHDNWSNCRFELIL